MDQAQTAEANRLWGKIKPHVYSWRYRNDPDQLFFCDEVNDLDYKMRMPWKHPLEENDLVRLNKLALIVDLHQQIQEAKARSQQLLEEEFALRPTCPICKKRVGRNGYYVAQDMRFNGESGEFACNTCRPEAARNS